MKLIFTLSAWLVLLLIFVAGLYFESLLLFYLLCIIFNNCLTLFVKTDYVGRLIVFVFSMIPFLNFLLGVLFIEPTAAELFSTKKENEKSIYDHLLNF
jgi:hypothetical protein